MSSGQRGFTLLEVVIAISIFALLGLGTYRMLDSVLRTDEATRANEQSLRELTRAFAALDRDLAQAAVRSVRDPYGDERAALLGELGAIDGSAAIELTRNGWLNPMGLARAQLQRVRWRLSDKTLERVYWTVLDQAVDSQPRVQTLLAGVRALEFRYMDERGEWQGQWPPASGERTPEENR
jgi:general secretion pathway protein J